MYPRIRELREDHDLGQKEVANFLNVCQRSYSKYERGETNIPPHALIKLAELYGTTVDYLLGLEPRRSWTGNEGKK